MNSNLTLTFDKPVKVNSTLRVNSSIIKIPQNVDSITIIYQVKKKNRLLIETYDSNIEKYPLTIKKIQFEDFWIIADHKVMLLPITSNKNVELTPTHSSIFFIGSLLLEFWHPLYRNFLKTQ
jgi:hypothetical protein